MVRNVWTWCGKNSSEDHGVNFQKCPDWGSCEGDKLVPSEAFWKALSADVRTFSHFLALHCIAYKFHLSQTDPRDALRYAHRANAQCDKLATVDGQTKLTTVATVDLPCMAKYFTRRRKGTNCHYGRFDTIACNTELAVTYR